VAFRGHRAKASILLSLVGRAPVEKAREALQVYRAWQRGEISYEDALAELKRLSGYRS